MKRTQKTTYVTWKGIEKAHEDVERLTQEAVDLLRKFPAKDDFLEELLKISGIPRGKIKGGILMVLEKIHKGK